MWVLGFLAVLGLALVQLVAYGGTGIAGAAETVEPPRLVTAPAEEISYTKAKLVGSVNPHGSPTTYYFAWGTSYYSLPNKTPVQSAGSGTHSEIFSQRINGLEPATNTSSSSWPPTAAEPARARSATW